MRYLLDTCIVLDANDANRFSTITPRVRALLGDESNELLLSAVVVTEMMIRTSIGKLDVPQNRLTEMMEALSLTRFPYTVSHARTLAKLPLHHRDPFDRMLIATAVAENIPFISSDTNLRPYVASSGLQLIGY
jgi:PIN domain nuclease of toxin-antitoxin system